MRRPYILQYENLSRFVAKQNEKCSRLPSFQHNAHTAPKNIIIFAVYYCFIRINFAIHAWVFWISYLSCSMRCSAKWARILSIVSFPLSLSLCVCVPLYIYFQCFFQFRTRCTNTITEYVIISSTHFFPHAALHFFYHSLGCVRFFLFFSHHFSHFTSFFSFDVCRCICQNYVCRKKIIVKRNRNVRLYGKLCVYTWNLEILCANCRIIKKTHTEPGVVRHAETQRDRGRMCLRNKRLFTHIVYYGIFHVSSYLSRYVERNERKL